MKLRQSVRTQMSLSLSSLVERQRLNSWIMGYTDKLQVDISVSDMQHCVHHAYMTACDYFGPTKSDVMLSSAVKASEALPAAKEFAPDHRERPRRQPLSVNDPDSLLAH